MRPYVIENGEPVEAQRGDAATHVLVPIEMVGPHEVRCGVREPGNGGRYEYLVWRVGDQWFAAFPDYHAASRIGSGKHYPDYVQEKMRVSYPDAVEMTKIINDALGVPE
jgi:hypothetical protein